MARITVEDCLKQVPNRFLLVMVASKRTKQLYKGSRALIENKSKNKRIVLCLREVAAGKVDYEIPARKG
jgi:DNA-directed RNA polymerase subunit omega